MNNKIIKIILTVMLILTGCISGCYFYVSQSPIILKSIYLVILIFGCIIGIRHREYYYPEYKYRKRTGIKEFLIQIPAFFPFAITILMVENVMDLSLFHKIYPDMVDVSTLVGIVLFLFIVYIICFLILLCFNFHKK